MTNEFDPTRLEALARARDVARAIARDLNDRYQDARGRADELRRAAALARQNAAATAGVARSSGDHEADRLEAEAETLRDRMADLRVDIDAKNAAAADAGRLLAACLAFAREAGLNIPTALAAEGPAREWMQRAPIAEAAR
jgi:hypothetical protein